MWLHQNNAAWVRDRQKPDRVAHLEEKSMKSTKMILKNLLKEESGQDLIEYGLIAALIALAAVTIMGSIGNSLKSVFTDINGNL